MERRKEDLVVKQEARGKKQVKPYLAPKLTVHGPVAEITKTGGAAATTDTVFTHSQ